MKIIYGFKTIFTGVQEQNRASQGYKSKMRSLVLWMRDVSLYYCIYQMATYAQYQNYTRGRKHDHTHQQRTTITARHNTNNKAQHRWQHKTPISTQKADSNHCHFLHLLLVFNSHVGLEPSFTILTFAKSFWVRELNSDEVGFGSWARINLTSGVELG